MKKENMIISAGAGNPTPSHDKHTQLGTEKNYLNIIKVIQEKPTGDILLDGEGLKGFPLQSGTRQELSPPLLNLLPEVLGRSN